MAASSNALAVSVQTFAGEANPAAELRSRVVALTRYGLARQAAGDIQAAAEAFRGVTDMMPGLALGWNNLALALSSLGDHEAAVAALRCSLSLDPDPSASWTSLANTLLQLGRFEEADAACGEALGRDVTDAAAWQIRATACAGQDDFPGAAEAFRRTLELVGESAPLRASLGAMLFRCGRFADAARQLKISLLLDAAAPATVEMANLCQFILAALDGDMAGARRVYGPAAATPGPEMDRVFKTALLYLDAGGHAEAARLVAEDWAAWRPDDVEARHFRDATAARPVERQPAELVTRHFDGIAATFETRMRSLDYEGPDRVAALLAAWIPPQGTLDVLDAGCGTGLCAPVLRPYARRLAGFDLSPRMLAQARGRDLYDSLEVADLTRALEGQAACWDLILAADVLPYIGRLEAVFAAAATALKPGGWFAVSTEAGDGDGPVLRGNGRYAHGRAYVEALAADRFEIVEHTSAVLRREAGRPVDGNYVLLRKLGG